MLQRARIPLRKGWECVKLIVGYLGMVVGLEFLGKWVEFGLLIAIAVMGAFIIYFNDKKK